MNHFAGSIPSELGGMKNLEYASAQNNSLTGPIPTEISRLGSLCKFCWTQRNCCCSLLRLTVLSPLSSRFQFRGECTNRTSARSIEPDKPKAASLISKSFDRLIA